MPTLSRFKERVFKIGKWLGIAVATILVIIIVFKGIFAIKEIISPTPPPSPTVKFGKVDKINFPEGIKKNLTFSIDTLSGELPVFSDRETVFRMATYEPDLLAVEKANAKIKSLGFEEKPEQLSETVYRWRATEPFDKFLVLNTNFPEFTLTSTYATNPAVLSAQNLPTEIDAKNIAKSFIQAVAEFPEDIDEEKTTAVLYSINQRLISPARNISNTNLISIFFYQKDKGKLPIVYPTNKSTMNLTISGGSIEADLIDARFFYQKIGEENATYPIKSSREAFEEIQNGKGFIASVDRDAEAIIIKKVYLAYYVGKQRQEYLLPVVVFEGSNNYLAYVSALKDEWFQN